jgi:hypothetical protein
MGIARLVVFVGRVGLWVVAIVVVVSLVEAIVRRLRRRT